MRVDPNNSSKSSPERAGLYFSATVERAGPGRATNLSTPSDRSSDLELTNVGVTRFLAAVKEPRIRDNCQFNLDQNGTNGLYKGTMPAPAASDFTPSI